MAAPEPRLGPLVHRAVHHGAALWLVGALQFVVAMAVVQMAWTGHPGYSLLNNHISDLGNTQCGPWPHASSPNLCSPWHDVFDVSVGLVGLFVILGAVLVRTGFPPRRTSLVGLGMMAVGGIGSIGVGLAPENVHPLVHIVSALIAFVIGNLALVVLGFAMFRDTRWDGYRAYTLLSGVVGLVATGLYIGGVYAGLGEGGMERLIVAPLLLWLVLASIHLLRVPQYAPHGLPSPSKR